MKFLFKLMDNFLKLGAIACITGMVAVVILQVYARALLPQVPSWTEELSRLLFIYTIGFAAGPAIREKAYVNVDIILAKLSEKARGRLEVFMDILLLGFNVIFTFEAYKLLLAVGGTTSAALIWPMESFYGGILIMALFVTIYLVLAIIDALIAVRHRKEEAAQ